jgi:ABC-type nickel/cobalt efflux system permease component RcnA
MPLPLLIAAALFLLLGIWLLVAEIRHERKKAAKRARKRKRREARRDIENITVAAARQMVDTARRARE